LTELGTKQDEINAGDLAITDTAGLATALAGKQDEINANDLAITDTAGLATALAGKQDEINANDLAISDTAGLATALAGKQDEINADDLAITDTAGLATALAGKQDEINANDLAITDTAGLATALAGKQDEINADDLAITDTAGLQTALNGKQATIDEDTDLTSNSLTTTDLVVNDSLNIDNVITYEKYKQFDTLVLRRVPTSDVFFNINEIQVWVNDTNIMYQNASTLNGYFALFANNSVELEAVAGEEVDKVYNNIILTSVESFGTSGTDSIIIKNIPSTFINDIQSIVLYYRTNDNTGRILNLQFELYNSVNDPDLTQILAQTPTITSVEDSYRYDFPSFDTYTLGTSTGDSTTQITSGGSIEDGIINTFDAEVNISGDLTSDTLTTTDLVVNGGVDIDTHKYFDTLVVRRLNGATDVANPISLRELQVWINDSNLLVENSATLDSYFVNWLVDKEADLGCLDTNPASNAYNNVLDTTFDTGSDVGANSLIITDIPSTNINDIQALVYYNRNTPFWQPKAIGLVIELYKKTNDPDLIIPLATTDEISVSAPVYRFDFPSLSTYSDFVEEDSLTNIVEDTYAETETVNYVPTPFEVKGNVDITGGLSVDIITTTGNVNITGDLNVEGGVNIDTGEYFDTLVVRRPTGTTGRTDDYRIALRELQVWVNGTNILVENSASLTSYFALWDTDKNADVGFTNPASNIYNNIVEDIDSTLGAVSSTASVANPENVLVIKDIPLTSINAIQALVLYNRVVSDTGTRAIGLEIGLYNETNDPNFTQPLATTDEISVSAPVYRFDFPSLSTYTDFATGNSLTNIIREEDATTETANYVLTTFAVKGNASITGDLVVGTTNNKCY